MTIPIPALFSASRSCWVGPTPVELGKKCHSTRRGQISEVLSPRAPPASSRLAWQSAAAADYTPPGRDEAFRYLDEAIEAGFDAASQIRSDDDLDNLRGDPRHAQA